MHLFVHLFVHNCLPQNLVDRIHQASVGDVVETNGELFELDVVVDHYFEKSFRATNLTIIRQCLELLVFELSSVVLGKKV